MMSGDAMQTKNTLLKNTEVSAEERTEVREIIKRFLKSKINDNLSPKLKAKVKSKFYEYIESTYKEWVWVISMTADEKNSLHHAQQRYREAMDKTKTITLPNGGTKQVVLWDWQKNRDLFKPPTGFGNSDHDRAAAAWKRAVIKGTTPENGLITATPNPYILDL